MEKTKGMEEYSTGKTLPEKKIRVGAISATIWKNEGTSKVGESYTYRTVSFERSYKDKAGAWQSTNSLRVNDLPKASLVLAKAYEFVALDEAVDETI